MEDEQTVLETTETETQEQTDDTSEEFSGKKALISQIKNLQNQIKQRDEADAVRTANEKKKAEAAERKRLEEQGEWQKIAEGAKNEVDALKASHIAEIRKLTLKAELAGMDELALKGAIASCPDDVDVSEYAKSIKKDYAHLFAGAETIKRTVAQGARSSTSSKNKSLRERLADGDQEAMRHVYESVRAGQTVDLD